MGTGAGTGDSTETGVELRDKLGHLQGVLRGSRLEIRRGGVVTVYDVRTGRCIESRQVREDKRADLRASMKARLGVENAE
jgi:hypothetical protein